MPTLHEIYLESKQLKSALYKRSLQFGIPFMYVCKEVGVDYAAFINLYMNKVDSSKSPITEKQFSAILELYGIKTKIQFVIEKNFDAEKTKKYLEENYVKRRKPNADTEEAGAVADVEQGDDGPDGFEF